VCDLPVLVHLPGTLHSIMPGLWGSISFTYNFLSTVAIDSGVALYNALTPNLPKGTVIKPGCPGHGGQWPPFEAAKEGDSRSPCPALNAMANHGILPRDGKNIRYIDLSKKIHETYNFANTVSIVPLLFTSDRSKS
jgi:hypothetical protein